MSNDPDLLDVWVECPRCRGEGTIRNRQDLDETCKRCHGLGGWETNA